MSALITGYDGISDVHGYFNALVRLFRKMDYRHDGNILIPPAGKQAVFLGDGPDRGPRQKKSIKLMWDMVAHGNALMCLGNHELNIVKLLTMGLDGKPLRDANDPFVQNQHQAFLDEIVLDSLDHRALVEWYKTIPLFLELDGISYVHACWHQESIDIIKYHLGENNPSLGDEGMELFKNNKEFREAVYMTLYGPEHKLPDGFEYVDARQITRNIARNMWASTKKKLNERTYLNGEEPPPHLKAKIDKMSKNRIYGPKEVVLNFAHYDLIGEPHVAKSRDDMVCIDFRGALTAYRFIIGDTRISENQLVWVPQELQLTAA